MARYPWPYFETHPKPASHLRARRPKLRVESSLVLQPYLFTVARNREPDNEPAALAIDGCGARLTSAEQR